MGGRGETWNGSGKRDEVGDKKDVEMLVTGFPFNTPKKQLEEKLVQIERDLQVEFKDKFAPALL
eukprot:11174695-Karenia_brevis.AAC.1